VRIQAVVQIDFRTDDIVGSSLYSMDETYKLPLCFAVPSSGVISTYRSRGSPARRAASLKKRLDTGHLSRLLCDKSRTVVRMRNDDNA